MLRRWIPALMLAACCLAFSGCQDSASAQNTIAPAQLSQQEQEIQSDFAQLITITFSAAG